MDKKILEEMIIVKFDAIIDENFCGSLCVFDPSCKSFNYNVAVKQCQLLASDLHLKNSTKPGNANLQYQKAKLFLYADFITSR